MKAQIDSEIIENFVQIPQGCDILIEYLNESNDDETKRYIARYSFSLEELLNALKNNEAI